MGLPADTGVEPPEPPRGYVVRPPKRLDAKNLEQVRQCYALPSWRLDGSSGELRPPARLPAGEAAENPIWGLGSCGCPAGAVRARFVDFCLRHIKDRIDRERPLVYASLGSGKLYHDWEVLEELLGAGYKVSSVHVVDRSYMGSLQEAEEMNARVGEALRAFSGWLQAAGLEVLAYRSTADLTEAVGGGAHILMQCDAHFPDERIAPALALGGLHLHLSQGTGELMEAWRRPNLPKSCGYVDSTRSEHALMDGLSFIERLPGSGSLQTQLPGAAASRKTQLNRARLREQALRAGSLVRVVGEKFPEQWRLGVIGACRKPRKNAGITGVHAKGDELILDMKTQLDNDAGIWVQLAREQLGGFTGSDPGWILWRPRMVVDGRQVQEVPQKLRLVETVRA